jgi:undecaprenyl-diphosphatase
MKDLFYKMLKRDEEVSSRLALENPPRPIELLLQIISHSCDSWYWMVGLVLLWALSNRAGKEIAVTTAFVTGTLAFVVLLVKFLFRRPRPEGDWGQIYRVNDPHSFPSGHAARAAAIVIVAAHLLPWWAVMLVVVWAILVGYSRVALKVHYLSDVLFGFLFGALFALVMLWVFAFLMQIFPKFARFLYQGF